MNRLCESLLARCGAASMQLRYDRARIQRGVVHFGPGAFHRAHQAEFVDRLLAEDPRWGISAVSLRSSGVRDALAPQDHLYALAELDAESRIRVIGALREIIVAAERPELVLQRMAAPSTRLVTITVTEKGYCFDGRWRLDLEHPDIRHDLAEPHHPCSLVGWLVRSLQHRRSVTNAPLAIISCDNIQGNGERLREAVLDFTGQTDPSLARWIERTVVFPSSMVDSITPATDDALREHVAASLGLFDAWPVRRERFSQWVVQNVLPPDGPDLASVGVLLVDDVALYERMKLRLLNGAHSTLAYAGLLRGHGTVDEAMRDEHLRQLVTALMHEDIAASLGATPGLDVAHYSRQVLQRFTNPAIRHQLAQIAWDGSQKLPVRLLGTIRDALEAGRPLDRLAVPVAAWFHFVRQQVARGRPLIDPLAPTLTAIASRCTGDAAVDVEQFLALHQVFEGALAQHSQWRRALQSAYARLPEFD